MKKITFILLIIISLFIVSCNKQLNTYITQNIYERTYKGSDIVYVNSDLFYFSFYYQIDTIPLEQWTTNIIETDSTCIEQKTITKTIDEKTNYEFVLSKYIYPTNLYYYTLSITYTGKSKDIYKYK
jgi:hypothetical protein